ncbi:MAG: hypothetical protein AUJ56_09915 [Zetaproteobacteria bacterium CG1_02_49_23]|nr:MAG: hypothetical protein AUJ56_09915 [Zetaproteobacteria bacterium CG1_02_49_23]
MGQFTRWSLSVIPIWMEPSMLFNGITGNVFLAKTEIRDHPEQVLERLEKIELISFRSAHLIKQLLIFCRRDRVDMHPLALTPLIKEACNLIRTGVPENINLSFDYTDETIVVNGDITQIHQILMNLINNARDAVENEKEPTITVALDVVEVNSAMLVKHPKNKAGQYARMRVEDNGSGIETEQIGHLFEPFFTTKEVGKGTGLGLSMVFGAVENHHGFIELKSQKGLGSLFEVYLPMTVPQAETKELTQQETSYLHQGKGETILIVDDEKALVDITAELLEKMGYHTLMAHNGLEAIDVFSEHKAEIKAILMDVIMPRCGGVEAAAHIRKENPDVGITFTTGYDQLKAPDVHKINTPDAVLSKPYSVEALGEAISRMIYKDNA